MNLLFVTGSRGEWGYIRPILEICKKKKVKFKLCATNMHLLDSFGYSAKEIVNDGFKIDESIYMSLDGYNNITTTKSLGVFMISFADVINKLKPDWVVLAGDRAETLVASISSAYAGVPIAHIQAGEVSGILDGQARHAIGKFANIHFASNKDAYLRLLRLGEEKFRVKLVGAPQLDDLHNYTRLNRSSKYDVKREFNIALSKDYALCIYHPARRKPEETRKEFKEIYNFLNKLDLIKIWISPNNDSGSNIIRNEFMKCRDTNDVIFDNLPRKKYLQLLKYAKFIIGNSSSGIIESPTYKIPCINIGNRQDGRYRAFNVIDVKKINFSNLMKAYKKLLSINFKNKIKKLKNPYGDGKSSERIVNELLKTNIDDNLLTKKITF